MSTAAAVKPGSENNSPFGVAKEGDSTARPEPTQPPDKSATLMQPMDFDEREKSRQPRLVP